MGGARRRLAFLWQVFLGVLSPLGGRGAAQTKGFLGNWTARLRDSLDSNPCGQL